MHHLCACLVNRFFAVIPDHEVRAAKLTNRWISGCLWGRDALSDEHLVGTKHGLLKCRSVRRKPLGGRRETGEEHCTKLNFDVEVDGGVQAPLEPPRQEAIPTVPPTKHSESRHAGLKSAELLDAQHVRLPVLGNLTLVTAKTFQDAWEESRRTATAEEVEAWRRS